MEQYVSLLTTEAIEQNLVSSATIPQIWNRHILDSLQLTDLADEHGAWVDLGSGAGLPGLVIGIATPRAMTLIEPRKRRAAFLISAVDTLARTNVQIIAARSEAATPPEPAIVSARAVAPLEQLFSMASHFTSRRTQWILPKGRSAAEEVAAAKQTWQGDFRLVPSLTEPGSSIVIARDIRRRGQA